MKKLTKQMLGVYAVITNDTISIAIAEPNVMFVVSYTVLMLALVQLKMAGTVSIEVVE